MQNVFIYMDDSGKLTKNEDFSLYSGIVFLSKSEMMKFSNKYKNILKGFKCRYCGKKNTSCDKKCIEIKSSKIKNKHRRIIINLCKKYKTFSFVIENKRIYDYILKNKASKGRYIDFAMKLTIKDIVNALIYDGYLNENEDTKMNVRIDQQTTKSNGYYNLRDGLFEELSHGVSNYNYGASRSPVLNGKLELNIAYLDSKKNVYIQASDILAGTTRRVMYFDDSLENRIQRINTYIWLLKIFP